MASNEIESDHSGGWSDEPEEDDRESGLYDDEMADWARTLARRTATGDWCTCARCWPVQDALTASDVTCCQESYAARILCNGNYEFHVQLAYGCVTDHPSFYHFCLYEYHLRNIAHVYQRAGHNPQGVAANQRLRYTAYCSYTVWAHGHLGRQNRKEIPHCVLKAIRTRFPAQDGVYTGFLEPEQLDI